MTAMKVRPGSEVNPRNRQPPKRRAYFSAIVRDFWAAKSRSNTARQPALRSLRCLTMQAVIFGILGISAEHSRNASPVHICCASSV